MGEALRSLQRKFQEPKQFKDKGTKAVGDSLLSFVMFNQETYNHVRDNELYLRKTLTKVNDGFTSSTPLEKRIIKDFPNKSMALKVIWLPIKKEGLTAVPVWDGKPGPGRKLEEENPPHTWPRVVAVDPSGSFPAKAAEVAFAGKTHADAHVVPLTDFYHFAITAEQLPGIRAQPGFGGTREGDYVACVGMHLTTKEIPDWVWATFWWHDQPNQPRYGNDRPDQVRGVWRNYVMEVTYSMDTPKEPDGLPHVCYNPWLENHFKNGTMSNCMTCHRRAVWPAVEFLPVTRGAVSPKDPMFRTHTKVDFMWSIADEAK